VPPAGTNDLDDQNALPAFETEGDPLTTHASGELD
jgi:hypothetical protein